MNDDLCQKVFDKLDIITSGLSGLDKQVALLSLKLDTHLSESANDKTLAANEKSSVRVNLASWVLIGMIGTVVCVTLYALKAGWRP